MADPMLQILIDERASRVGLIESVTKTAADQGRDLSDQDMETITLARTRLNDIDRQLEFVGVSDELDEQIQERLARVHPGQVSQPSTVYHTLGQLVWDGLHRGQDREAAQRWDKMLTRAAQHMGTVAADTTATAGDLAGLVVDPIVGPLTQFKDWSRPFLSAIGTTTVAAYDFRRPYMSDANVGSTAQATQKAEVGSTAFSVASDTLEMATYAEYLNVSQQLISFQPESLQIVIDQLRNRVARGIEKAAYTELSSSTTKVTLTTAAVDAATVNAAIEDGIAKVYTETGRDAQWILMSPTGRARLGKVADSAGRPLYPYLNPSNAQGSNVNNGGSVNGLRPITTYAMTDLTYWIGNAGCFEAYEYPFPMMEVAEPSLLGRQVGFGVAAAFYRPRSASGQLGATHLAP